MELGTWADWTAGLVAFVALAVASITQFIQFFDRRNADAEGLRVSLVQSVAMNHHRYLYGTAVKLLNEDGRAKSRIKVHMTEGSKGGIDFPTLTFPEFNLGGFDDRTLSRKDNDGGAMTITFDILPRNEKAAAIFYTPEFEDRQVLVYFNDFRGKRWVFDYESGKLKKAKPADEPELSFNDLSSEM
ncbi:hypothetical protein GSU68_09865 [Rathayibacter sp. VKM Ac-2759]|uniref:hypothetical protein n=1 Tax=Rathayibacter sp. VKM Ac-2759 TaxID=2609252 RepID=UPI0013175AB2|nr:hypothetical protein [Rathayibacter sp. VKM Ac-2759]QHC66834.1 hypothetical protein GSU68_09865 [Rathayibacter sp. VKM Ac-2759]